MLYRSRYLIHMLCCFVHWSEDGSAFLETSMDIGNSLLFHSHLFNEIIGWGTPLFEQNSHRMVAWREAALKKEEKERTIVTMFVDLTLAQ